MWAPNPTPYKVLAEGSTTATRSPKLPELWERQNASWSPGKAGRLPPPCTSYGGSYTRSVIKDRRRFCSQLPGTSLEPPRGPAGLGLLSSRQPTAPHWLGRIPAFLGPSLAVLLSFPAAPDRLRSCPNNSKK